MSLNFEDSQQQNNTENLGRHHKQELDMEGKNIFRKLYKFLSRRANVFAFLMAFCLLLARGIGYIPFYIYFGLLLICAITGVAKPIKINKSWWIASTISLVIIPIIAIPFTETFYQSLKILGRVIPYFIVPIGLLFLNDSSREGFKKGLYKGLITGGLLASVILLSVNFYRFLTENPCHGIFSFFYTAHYFTSTLDKHPTYEGMEILFALTLLFNYLKRETKKTNIVWNIISIILLITTLIFINSRSITFLMVLVLLYNLLQKIISLIRRKKFKALSIIIIGTLVISIGLYQILKKSYVFYRFSTELSWDLSYQSGTLINSTDVGDSRVARWKSALKLVKRKPIVGYGNKTEKNILLQQYKKDGLVQALENQYGAHNSYLSYTLEYGLVGLIILLMFFGSNLLIALKAKQTDWIFLCCFIIFVSIFEDYIRISEGVFMTALFLNIQIFSYKKREKIDKSQT